MPRFYERMNLDISLQNKCMRGIRMKSFKKITNFVLGAVLVVSLLFFILPFAIFVLTSLKPEKYLLGHFLPDQFTFYHYKNILPLIGKPILSSLAYSLASTVGVIIVSLFAAYSLSRFTYKYRDNIAYFFISLYMLPPIVTLVPIWSFAQRFNLLDTYGFLIWIHVIFNMPLTIWILRNYFIQIPKEIEEAAKVDGCSEMRTLLQITMPLAKPGIAVAGVLSFIFTWNEFMYATIMTSIKINPLTVLLTAQVSYYIRWGNLASMATLAIIPPLILSLLIQRNIISGLTFGAVKD